MIRSKNKRPEIWSGHPGQINETDFFKTSITIRAQRNTKWELAGYPYEIYIAT